MQHKFICLLLSAACFQFSCGQQPKKQNNQQAVTANSKDRIVGGGCDGCEIMYTRMPQAINAVDTSYGWHEKGTKLKVEGTVYQKDGITPAAGIIIYYWHTNAEGLYAPSATEKTLHGAIRGWMKTGADGTYTLYTIRPGSYPQSNIPQHIHIAMKEPRLSEYYIDDINFTDDPFLTAEEAKLTNRCGSGIVTVTKDENGLLHCKRDIVLGLNIPGY